MVSLRPPRRFNCRAFCFRRGRLGSGRFQRWGSQSSRVRSSARRNGLRPGYERSWLRSRQRPACLSTSVSLRRPASRNWIHCPQWNWAARLIRSKLRRRAQLTPRPGRARRPGPAPRRLSGFRAPNTRACRMAGKRCWRWEPLSNCRRDRVRRFGPQAGLGLQRTQPFPGRPSWFRARARSAQWACLRLAWTCRPAGDTRLGSSGLNRSARSPHRPWPARPREEWLPRGWLLRRRCRSAYQRRLAPPGRPFRGLSRGFCPPRRPLSVRRWPFRRGGSRRRRRQRQSVSRPRLRRACPGRRVGRASARGWRPPSVRFAPSKNGPRPSQARRWRCGCLRPEPPHRAHGPRVARRLRSRRCSGRRWCRCVPSGRRCRRRSFRQRFRVRLVLRGLARNRYLRLSSDGRPNCPHMNRHGGWPASLVGSLQSLRRPPR